MQDEEPPTCDGDGFFPTADADPDELLYTGPFAVDAGHCVRFAPI